MSRMTNWFQTTVYLEAVRKEKTKSEAVNNNTDLTVKGTSSLRAGRVEGVTANAPGEGAGVP